MVKKNVYFLKVVDIVCFIHLYDAQDDITVVYLILRGRLLNTGFKSP